jgi:hypothetical protein
MTLVNIDKADKVNAEIILPGMRDFSALRVASLENRVFLTGSTALIAEHSFKCDLLPSALFGENGTATVFRELVAVNNLIVKAENIVSAIESEEKRRAEERRQVEDGLRNTPQSKKSKNAIAFAAAMEQVGRVLRRDLSDIPKFVAKRSTDKEMVKGIEKMVDDAYRNYMLQITKANID